MYFGRRSCGVLLAVSPWPAKLAVRARWTCSGKLLQRSSGLAGWMNPSCSNWPGVKGDPTGPNAGRHLSVMNDGGDWPRLADLGILAASMSVNSLAACSAAQGPASAPRLARRSEVSGRLPTSLAACPASEGAGSSPTLANVDTEPGAAPRWTGRRRRRPRPDWPPPDWPRGAAPRKPPQPLHRQLPQAALTTGRATGRGRRHPAICGRHPQPGRHRTGRHRTGRHPQPPEVAEPPKTGRRQFQ